MELVTTTYETISPWVDFLTKELPSNFRYFTNRSLKVVSQHIVTVIATQNSIPVGYGHIDRENNINWVGICVIESHQHQGIGRYILDFLHKTSKTLSVPLLQLAVDKVNTPAFRLYSEFGYFVHSKNEHYYIMRKHISICLPVSLGEAIDKLTILDIKKEKIDNIESLNNIKLEYDLITNELDIDIKNNFYYKLLKLVNLEIWEKQDIFRYSSNKEEKNALCINIIDYNDRRFRIKKKINTGHSIIKEEKSYVKSQAFILSHLGLGDQIILNPLVRYIGTKYDKVTLVVKKSNLFNIQQLYSDDPFIDFHIVDDDKEISPNYGADSTILSNISSKNTVYTCGFHKNKHHTFNDFPFCFYDDMDIPRDVYYDYGFITNRYAIKCPDEPYVFIHSQNSQGDEIDIDVIERILHINRYEKLVLDPYMCHYKNGDKFYEVAQQIVNLPLLSYPYIIEKAEKLFMVDSSFMCLALYLDLTASIFYVCARHRDDYSKLLKNKGIPMKIVLFENLLV